MYCKDCKFWGKDDSFNETMICDNDKLDEEFRQHDRGDMLIYSYQEGGYFETGPDFGCVHFEQRVEINQ